MSPKSAIGPRDEPNRPPMETHWLAEDDECGVFGSGPRTYVITQIADHFIAHHPDVNPIVDGVHYRLYEAPWRCDCCGVNTEPPYWTHKSIGEIVLPLLVDNAGEWLLCQDCHQFVVAREPIRLAIRMIRMHQQNSPWVLAGEAGENVRVHMTEMAREYVEKFDDGYLEADASRH